MRRQDARPALMLALAMALAGAEVAWAQTTGTWVNTAGGTYSDASSWSNGVVPDAAAFFTSNGSYTVTLDSNVVIGTLRLWASNPVFRVPSGYWLFVTNAGGVGGNNNNGLSLTHPSAMTLLIDGGTVTNSGFHLGGTAKIVISNNGTLITRAMGQPRIERNGSLTMYSGRWDHGPTLEVAYDGTPGAVATVDLLGGQALFRANVSIGARETGIMTINGGVLTNWQDIAIGAQAPSFYGYATGLVNLASGNLIHIRNLFIGDIGHDSTNRSQFTITGGEYRNLTNANAQIRVGNRSTGALHVAAGSFVATNGVPFWIGNAATGTNPRGVGYVTNSGTMRLSTASLIRGLWRIHGGEVFVNGTLWVTSSLGQLEFPSGLIVAGSLVASNGSAVTVGDGSASAVLAVNGDALFGDGLQLNALSALQITNTGVNRIVGNIGGAGSVLKAGEGWAILEGVNTYSGGTTSSVGILEAVGPAALPGYNTPGQVVVRPGATLAVLAAAGTGQWTAPDVDALLANVTFEAGAILGFDVASNAFSYAGAIAGNRGLLKLGTGVLTLSGSSTYTRETAIRNGTLQLGAHHPLWANSHVILGDTTTVANAGTLDLNGYNLRIGKLYTTTLTNSNANATNRVVIPLGSTLVVATNHNVDFLHIQSGTHLAMTGGGRLAVTNPAGTVRIWGYRGTADTEYRGLDLSELDEFAANVSLLVVGYDGGNEGQTSKRAMLTLALTNTIRAGTFSIASSGRDGSVHGRVYLGESNSLTVGTLQIGYDKATGWLTFREDISSGSVWISGLNPGERANITQGEFRSAPSGTQPHGYLLVTNDGVSIHAYLDNWYLGSVAAGSPNSSVAGGRGTALIRDGEINVNTVTVGRVLSGFSQGTAEGWLTLLGGTMTVNQRIVLGLQLSGTASRGTLAISGGVVSVYGDIADGGGTSTLVLDGGTLDMNGNQIGSGSSPIDTLTIASGELRNVGQINGGADWNKTGAGTLTIGGTNSFSGTLNILQGVVRYDGYHSGPGLITVQAGGVLAGTGQVGQVWVYSGGLLSPGHSVGTLTADGDVAFTSGSEFEVEILGPLSGQYDQLWMGSSYELTLGGAVLSVFAPNPLPYGTVFPIISGWGSIDSSTFLGLPDGATFTAGVNEFQIHYGTLAGYDDDVTLTVVPEPGTLATLTLALAVGAVLRRRLRR